MGRRVALAAGVGALIGLAWWGVFAIIASGAVCTSENWGCLRAAVLTLPIFTVVAAALGWFALRSSQVSRAGWLALPATLMSVTAMLLLFPIGLSALAFAVFGGFYTLAAVLTGLR